MNPLRFRNTIISGIIIPASLLLFTSCRHNPLDVDVSQIKVAPVKIDRLERDMFSMNPDSITKYSSYMLKKYGRFYPKFLSGFINNGGMLDTSYSLSLRRFITDKDMHDAYNACEKTYPTLSFLETGFTDAFRHYKYYFPDSALPRVITAMSGFNYSLLFFDNTLAISLEMYLGGDNNFYQMLTFPAYKTLHMNRNYLLSDALYGWLESVYKPNEERQDFLSNIIHEGKIMYLLDALLPAANDTIKIKYSRKQLEWCRQNEFNIWAYIIQQKILYSTDETVIAKFTDDGPFTPMFNHDFCPARTGNWLGWEIVRTYMKNNPSVTIPQLMTEKSADRILAQSGYKPAK